MSEDSLAAAVAEVVAAHPDEWARFCDGDERDRRVLHREGHGGDPGKADGKAVRAELARLRG